jgi:GDPmannose 4,6-dehydratase
MKRALICGVSGQDGAYLAHLLLGKGYEVIGTSRDAELNSFGNLERLGVRGRVQLLSMAPADFRSVNQAVLKAEPDEIYNLSGQTSVGLSFLQPVETLDSISVATLNLLEAIRFSKKKMRFYNACSSECFGQTAAPATEETAFHPRSPYAVAKAAAFWETSIYREAYGLFACSGILYNHESPLRHVRFVTQKIITGAREIAAGRAKTLALGNLSIERDWGWAAEYVEAMWLMLQQEQPGDYVVATGEKHSLQAFVAEAFRVHKLDWREFVTADASLLRPADILSGCGNPAKAKQVLNWQAKYRMKDVVAKMSDAQLF